MATHSRQMSDAFRTTVFLTLSGGFQDAYTYMGRGKVFANAQTGNIVLMATNFARVILPKALRYLCRCWPLPPVSILPRASATATT